MAQLRFTCLFQYLLTTNLKHLWQQLQPMVFLDMKSCTSGFGNILPFFSADTLKFFQDIWRDFPLR